jgi:hypothetical protein
MVGTGAAIEAASRANNIDDAFALAVWWTETNDGEAGVGRADLNPGSVRGSVGYPSAYDGYTIYPSFSAAVNYWFGMMKKVYIDRGLTTVYTICHPYVGTSTADLWAGKVVALMETYRAEAPPAPTPTPTIPPSELRNIQAIATQQARNPQLSASPTSTASFATPTAQATPVRSAVTSTAHTGGLSAHTQQVLVWLDLLIALALAFWAMTITKKASESARVVGMLESSDLSERLRVNRQTPGQFGRPLMSTPFQAFADGPGPFASFGGEAPVTEALNAYYAPGLFFTTETLPPLAQNQPLDARQEQIAQTATGPLPVLKPVAADFTPTVFQEQSAWPIELDDTPTPRLPVGAGSGRSGGLLSRYRDGGFSS